MNKNKAMKDSLKSPCPLCGGRKVNGTTTYSADLGNGVVVVRRVPAAVCDQCGEAWISPEVARRLETIANDAREKGAQTEVIAM